jgi:hypothetical protein
VYSLEYTEIPKVFFTPHHGRWRQQGNQENNKCAIIPNTTMLSKVIVESMWTNATVATMWTKVIIATMSFDNVIKDVAVRYGLVRCSSLVLKREEHLLLRNNLHTFEGNCVLCAKGVFVVFLMFLNRNNTAIRVNISSIFCRQWQRNNIRPKYLSTSPFCFMLPWQTSWI